MTLDNAIANRRSIRRYKTDSLTKEQIKAILTAGNSAPSAKNGQQWRFHVFHKEAKERFASFCLEEFDKLVADSGVPPFPRHSFTTMKEAPVIVLVFCIDNPLSHPSRPDIQSVSAAIQNMLLKAYDLGLGSLWICDILYIEKAVKQFLKTDMQVIAAVTFGYSTTEPRSISKLSINDVTTWQE
ncbi:MAG TPA: nitroreductase family protein [Candidatus Bathyarchaeia archaeon]|nr:nitroreductase family protein [Candidatus Bathyarchaeia archaeon]